MRQLGTICLCSLLLGVTSSTVSSSEIVEYSMYDEFGDIMFNAPGQLVREPGNNAFDLESALDTDRDITRYRYRSDAIDSSFSRTQNAVNEALTTYGKKRYNTDQVWKFRPLEEKKAKTIIKIEDEPAAQTLIAPMQVNPVQASPVQVNPVQVNPVQVSPVQVSPVPAQQTPAPATTQTYGAQTYSTVPSYQYSPYQPYTYSPYQSYQYPYSYPYQGYGYGTGMPFMPMAPMMPGLMFPMMPY